MFDVLVLVSRLDSRRARIDQSDQLRIRFRPAGRQRDQRRQQQAGEKSDEVSIPSSKPRNAPVAVVRFQNMPRLRLVPRHRGAGEMQTFFPTSSDQADATCNIKVSASHGHEGDTLTAVDDGILSDKSLRLQFSRDHGHVRTREAGNGQFVFRRQT